MFADTLGNEDGATTTLFLQSTQSAKTVHGFTDSAFTTFGGILTAETGKTLGNNTKTGLSMEETSEESVGYYTFASTLASGVTVTFTANPMTTTIGEGEGAVTHYVPYKFKWTKSTGTAGVADGSIDLGISTPITDTRPSTTAVYSSAAITVFTGALPTGPKWASLDLDIQFDGANNIAYGLPEGTYSGSVVATIAAP